MSLIDRGISILAPHDCLNCGTEGNLLCPKCLADLPTIPDRCYRCRRASPGGLTCTACRSASRLVRVRAGTIYETVAKDLVWQLKLAGAQAAALCMANRLQPFVDCRPGLLIVPVPTATSRIRRRGYDQAGLLARALARQTGQPFVNCLARLTQTHQHGWSRRQRLVQLAAGFRVRQPKIIQGAHIMLVDDVVTTGATLEAAALVLRQAGARYVEAVAFAQP